MPDLASPIADAPRTALITETTMYLSLLAGFAAGEDLTHHVNLREMP